MYYASEYKDDLKTQIRESYGRIVYTYTTHLKMMNYLDTKNAVVKYIKIGLSALSSGNILAAIITSQVALTWVGGIFSAILLALNLFFKEFNLVEESHQHRSISDNLWLVREDYVSLLTDFSILSDGEIIKRRDDLQLRVFEIYKNGPKTNSRSYKKAQKALKKEEEQFFSPKEIDDMLPAHLRSSR